MLNITVTRPPAWSSPSFTSRLMGDMLQRAQEDVAQYANVRIHTMLEQRIRNPTPYYRTQPTIERPPGQQIIHDRGIEYGPWLEGTSSRNRSSTFKGYHAWADALAQTDQASQAIIEQAFEPLTDQIGS